MGGTVNNNESRIARAERAHAEAQARRDAARARHGKVAGELADAKKMWAAATLATMPLDDFARLGARVELLRREVATAQAEYDRAERSYQPAREEYSTVHRSLMDARERLDRALRNGNAAGERAARAQIAALTGAEG